MENFVLWRHRARSVSRKIGGLAWARSSRTAPASADVGLPRLISDASPVTHSGARPAPRAAGAAPRRAAPRPPHPFLLWLAGCLACSECCPFGVRVWDPCSFRGIRHRCARSAALLGVQLVAPLSAPGSETASGRATERRLAPHARLAEGYATAWVLHNLNRTRTQNACVESGWHYCC